MFSEKLGHKLDVPLTLFIKCSMFSRISPVQLTLTGLLLNFIAAVTIVTGAWKIASLLIVIAGFFDMLDGATARTHQKTSLFGGFLDSVVDRYSDMALMTAFIIYYSRINDICMVSLVAVTAAGCALIPYARAKAEKYISHCNIGIMERAERIVLIAFACFFNIAEPLFWLLAILTHITVLQRIFYTRKEIQKLQITKSQQPPV